METTKHGRNIVSIRCKDGDQFLLLSDLHFDHPKCRRDLLQDHIEKAINLGAKILINGDFFCIMQGKYDKRASKDDIRPEHQGGNYFDLVVNEAVEWWAKYADHLLFVGYGNHETAVSKRHEIDLTERFVSLLNYKTGSKVLNGGYAGWIVFNVYRRDDAKTYLNFKVKYHHGHGGGGVVTKGVIQHQRMGAQVDGADVLWMGHVHELYHHINIKEALQVVTPYEIKQRIQHDIRTSTYKDEFTDGAFGWHIERGAYGKPIGGYLMRLNYVRDRKEKERNYINPDFQAIYSNI
jgi:UDP-2,3-diacylglucosamine pyrophosphatase LpxH